MPTTMVAALCPWCSRTDWRSTINWWNSGTAHTNVNLQFLFKKKNEKEKFVQFCPKWLRKFYRPRPIKKTLSASSITETNKKNKKNAQSTNWLKKSPISIGMIDSVIIAVHLTAALLYTLLNAVLNVSAIQHHDVAELTTWYVWIDGPGAQSPKSACRPGVNALTAKFLKEIVTRHLPSKILADERIFALSSFSPFADLNFVTHYKISKQKSLVA